MNENLVKTFFAEAAITKRRIVKFGAADNTCAQASSVGDYMIGVSTDIGADAAGDILDVVVNDIASVEYGGTVTRGQPLTSDIDGKAIAASDSIVQKIVAGGAAGNITVTGIKTTDELISVLRYDVETDTGSGASGDKIQSVTDLTSEFTITAADTINNLIGTDTSGDTLLVSYRRKDKTIGTAWISGVSGDIGAVLLGK